MTSVVSRIRQAIWTAPGPMLEAAGVRGELFVAKVRLVMSAGLLMIPLVNLFFGAVRREAIVGFAATGAVFLFSLITFLMVRRNPRRPILGIVTACFDVTLISATLASFFFVGAPHTAVNSKVVFEGYFLAFAATTLRYDRRVCTAAGLLAVLEYLAIVVVATTYWDLNGVEYAPYIYGQFSWGAQFSRLIALAVAAFMSLGGVVRTQRLLRLSTTDPLTGLFNRTHFAERVVAEIGRCSRSGEQLSIAIVDVDRFKEFNDRFGHSAGDRALKTIATALLQSFRKSDIVARYGGDEFVIAMPGTDLSAAHRKFDELRKTIAAEPLVASRGAEPFFIGISTGISLFPGDGATGEALLNAADGRLFEAKRAGRNRVVSGAV